MKYKGLIISVLVSIGLLIAIICLIWWNETVGFKSKKQIKAISTGAVDVDINSIDAKNDGKLVYLKGNLSYGEDGTGDYLFNIYVDSPKLTRIVEKYQYKEIKEGEDDNPTYRYEKVWSSSYINSSKFDNKSLVNDSDFKYESKDFYAEDLSIGNYKLSDSLKVQIETDTVYTELDPIVGSAYGLKVNGIYFTDSENVDDPQIGDIRISFKYSKVEKATVLAMQSFNSFITFTAGNGVTYNKLLGYEINKKGIVRKITNDNEILIWELRFSLLSVLFLLTFVSLRPITKYSGRIFFFGKINRSYLLILSLILSAIVYFIEAALVWLMYDPLISLLLLALIAVGVVLIYFSGKRNNILTKEEDLVLFSPEVLKDNSKQNLTEAYASEIGIDLKALEKESEEKNKM